MMRVVTALPAYRVAVAELPLSARAADDAPRGEAGEPGARGAVVVVPGSGSWAHAALRASRAGAAAVLVAHPTSADAVDLDALSAEPTPVVLDRPRLRTDATAASRAVSTARYRTAEVAAPRAGLAPALRDAIGWLRVLSGGTLTLTDVGRTDVGVLARLVSDADGIQCLLTASTLVGSAGGSRLRMHGIGETRIEVTIDEAAGTYLLDTSSAQGRNRLPRFHESPERLALRRTIDIAHDGVTMSDLTDFGHDQALAATILARRAG